MCPHNNPEHRLKDLDNSEVEKSKTFSNVDLIGYEPNSVVCRTIMKKPAGNISILSFNIDKGFSEKTSPFDTFIQIIDGKAEIIIDGTSNTKLRSYMKNGIIMKLGIMPIDFHYRFKNEVN